MAARSGVMAEAASRRVQKTITATSNVAEIAVLDQSATGREVTWRKMTTSMSPISVPQVRQAAIATQYHGLVTAE
jgi:hypothetical protein